MNKKVLNVCRIASVTIAVLATHSAMAWDGVVAGTVAQFDVVAPASGAHNYDFRVYLTGVPSVCAGAPVVNWAYINSDSPNYKTMTSAIMMASALGKRVTIYSHRNPTTNYCEIGYAMF